MNFLVCFAIIIEKKGGYKDMTLKEIQKRLRESIKLSGILQKTIAKEIGVSAQTVSKYMCEDIFPALDTLAKLCKLLDVKADYILGISPY